MAAEREEALIKFLAASTSDDPYIAILDLSQDARKTIVDLVGMFRKAFQDLEFSPEGKIQKVLIVGFGFRGFVEEASIVLAIGSSCEIDALEPNPYAYPYEKTFARVALLDHQHNTFGGVFAGTRVNYHTGRRGDISTLENNRYDIVFAGNINPIDQESPEFIARLHNCLRDGGILIASSNEEGNAIDLTLKTVFPKDTLKHYSVRIGNIHSSLGQGLAYHDLSVVGARKHG